MCCECYIRGTVSEKICTPVSERQDVCTEDNGLNSTNNQSADG